MPARKDSSLNKHHSTKGEQADRAAAEESMQPKTQLSIKPPASLKGHAHASATWSRIIKLYDQTKGKIITAFDENTLVEYCKLLEEEINIETKVKDIDGAHTSALKDAKKVKPTADNLKDWVAMWAQVNALTKNFKEMDARLDGKRKLKLALEQSLYLTPRSRAGVAPEEKDPEPEKSPMDNLLD